MISQHLLSDKWRNRFGDVIHQQARELMGYLADTLPATADGFDDEATALLRLIKYNDDTEGYKNVQTLRSSEVISQ